MELDSVLGFLRQGWANAVVEGKTAVGAHPGEEEGYPSIYDHLAEVVAGRVASHLEVVEEREEAVFRRQ